MNLGNAALAAFVAIALATSACSKVSQSTVTAPGGRGQPIPGVLRYAEVAEPDSLSPLISTQSVTADLSYLVFSYFFNIDDHENFVPEAALEVPTQANGGISADGKTITYHLRQGMKWQDGEPLTAKDVVFTYRAVMNPKNNVQVRTGYDQIADVEAKDDYTVVVHMKSVFSPIIAYFMCIQGQYPIMPAHLLEKYSDVNKIPYNEKPMGSGPFAVVQWVHGDRIELEANPLYWRGPPKLKRIIFKVLPSTTTIKTQLQTHEVDAWFRADVKLYPELAKLADYTTQLSPENVFGHIDFNLRDPLLQDQRVRMAVELAMDRGRIARDTTYGVYGTTDSDQPPFLWAYDPHVPAHHYDPEKARAMLDQAGWKPGPDGIRTKRGNRLEIQLSYVGGQAIATALAALVEEEEKAVGVAIVQKTYPASLYFASKQDGGIINGGKYQMAYFGWVSGVDPDDSSLYRCNQFPPQGQNNLFWCDAKVEAAELDALAHFDVERRKKDYAIIQAELANEVPTIFMFAERRVDVYPKSFSGYRASPATSSFWNSWEWSQE